MVWLGVGGMPGPRLDVADHVQPKMLGKVGKRIVIGHDLAPAIRLHLRVPLLLGRGQALVEILKALLEVGGVGGSSSPSLPAMPLAMRRPLSGSSQ